LIHTKNPQFLFLPQNKKDPSPYFGNPAYFYLTES